MIYIGAHTLWYNTHREAIIRLNLQDAIMIKGVTFRHEYIQIGAQIKISCAMSDNM